MNKQFWNALLCGAVVFSSGAFTSCSDDTDELENRVTVLEGVYGDLKAQLANALTTGASVTKVEQTNGVYTLTLSDGQVIRLTGGGSAIEVTVTDTEAIIEVDGTVYKLPLGSSVNSLIYSPETVDGIVELGMGGATVNLLPRPALSSIEGAVFTIAESHAVTRAADGEQFRVNEGVTLEDGFIKVPIKGLEVEAGGYYAVSVQMNYKGTVIGSNYFTIKVADDFSFNAEEIGGFTIKSEYAPSALTADGFCSMTVDGLALLEDDVNFRDFFSELPENAIFRIASPSKQPAGKAQEKYDLLSSSLAQDGTFAWSRPPLTSFNENAEQPGFLVNVVADDVVKAKIYLKITDGLADVDFTDNGLSGIFEAEWGGETKAMESGAQTLNFPKTISNYATEIPTIHNGADGFFANWANYSVKAGEDEFIYHNGTTLVMTDLAKKYAKGCRGIYWFFRGFAIYVPVSLTNENGKYVDVNGKEYSGGEGYGYDFWLGQYNEYVNDPTGFYSNIASWGFTMDESTGDFRFPETYTGYGLRIALGGGYEYAYGVKSTQPAGQDQFGMLFINRRIAPAGATMPAPQQ